MSILGIGRAYMDILSTVDENFLNRFSLQKGQGNPVPPDGLLDIGRSLKTVTLMPGGNAANTLSGLAVVGIPCALWGAVGADEAGYVFKQDLHKRGITDYVTVWDKAQSAICYVLITPDGERSFAYDPGIADTLTTDAFGPSATFPNGTGTILIEGLSLDRTENRKANERLIGELSHRDRIRIIVSLQDIQTSMCLDDLLGFVTTHADLIIGNQSEILALEKHITQHSPSSTLLSQMRADALQVTTKGAQGAEVVSAEGRRQRPSLSIAAQNIVDTTGAGDLFLAGLLHGMAQGASIEEAVDRGHAFAAVIIGTRGGRPDESFQEKLSLLTTTAL